VPSALLASIEAGTVRAVNMRHPQFKEILKETFTKQKKRVHILAIGDVGSTLLTGLHLLGGDVIESIGICDISDQVTARWEFEENQIAYPWDYDALPEVDVVRPEDLFKCDVFVFVASKGIPPVGSEVKDVRMYQFENNSKIVAGYARQARKENFKGLFAVVSDPVDPLTKTAYLESNRNDAGEFDYMGLRPEQVHGFGLGVMNARAAYYAKRDDRFTQFLTEGRSFGPHGEDLVVADSIENYNDELSKELTQLTVTANLKMRAIGFKPFVAPAYSSGAISLILMMRGCWHCGSVFLGGVYMGAKNRYTSYGLETEVLPLPEKLYERILLAQKNLQKII
ncbi:MAG: lactate dehydrogenase, partial [Hungatella sp.]